TAVVASQDGSIAALLGASPGASTVVHVMLEVLRRCFPKNMLEWEDKIKEMIPSYGVSLMDHPELLDQVQQTTAETLKLTESETVKTELAHS
ncbi:MAG: malate:quinone oxidoreductase, partial [Caldibacillus sp.]